MAQAQAPLGKVDPTKGLRLEDFIFALHTTVAANQGKLTLAALPEKYKELHGQEFRVEKFLYVANGRVDQALKRIPHVVLVKEENNETVICNSQKLDIDKEELLRIDQKYRDRAAALRATKKREQMTTPGTEVSAEKRPKEAPKSPPQAPPARSRSRSRSRAVAGKGKAAKAPPKPQAVVQAHVSKPAPPPPQKPFVATLQTPVVNAKVGAVVTAREPSPRSREEAPAVQAEAARKQDEPVVLHAILRLLEQQGPMSLSNLNDAFQTRWKCPFRPISLGVAETSGLEKYFRESKHFKLKSGPAGPILCLREPPVLKEMPNVLEQISAVRQQVALLDVKLEELTASLSRAAVQGPQQA